MSEPTPKATIGTSTTVTLGIASTLLISIVGTAVKVTSDREQTQAQINMVRNDLDSLSRSQSLGNADNRLTRLETIYSENEKKLARIESKLDQITDTLSRRPQ